MSSPLSHWSSSPDSPKSAVGNVLTPSRRVDALLAQFDDSSSEDEFRPRNTLKDAETEIDAEFVQPLVTEVSTREALGGASGEDEDEALPLAPRGRLGARLKAEGNVREPQARSDSDDGHAYVRVKKLLNLKSQTRQTTEEVQIPQGREDSEDELARREPRRRLMKRKASPMQEEQRPQQRGRSASPLFFPSPTASRKSPIPTRESHSSDSEGHPDKPLGGKSKFLALVEKHRTQRLAKEAEEIAKKAARVEKLMSTSDDARRQRGSSPADDSDEGNDASDPGAAKNLTKEARPTRKASKRALEEMNRETQRMSRNMQLAHQARTKKKITKESLLARFNFPFPGGASSIESHDGQKSTSASSAPTSDAEAAREHVTPPTSPIRDDEVAKDVGTVLQSVILSDKIRSALQDERLPLLEDIMTQTIVRTEKGKGKHIENRVPTTVQSAPKIVRPIKVKWSKQDAVIARAADSDSDLEIITAHSNTRKYAVFEQLPKHKARETESHLALRSLAHLVGSDDKTRSSMSAGEMEISLRRAAREQARRERRDKIEELKAKGVIIQTAEERDMEQQEVEDLVERARQEGAEIQRREKELAKKKGTLEKDGLDDSDDDEDEDFREDDGDAEEQRTSASEDEELDDEQEEDEESDPAAGVVDLENEDTRLIDHEAGEADSSEESEEEEDDAEALSLLDGDDSDHSIDTKGLPRRSRNTRVLSDDDEEDHHQESPSPHLPTPIPVKTPQSLSRSGRKIIPGLDMSDDLPIGLTQAFAATMADSQSQDAASDIEEQDSLEMTRDLPSPNLPFGPQLSRLDSLDVVSDSQPATQTQPLNLNLSFSQSQRIPQSPAIGLGIAVTPSQVPFEPTQDAGYMLSPFHGSRFGGETPSQRPPHSTVDTVILPGGSVESPLLRRKGRLRRGHAGDAENEEVDHPDSNGTSAFDVMRRAAKEKPTEVYFDKSRSAAKDIIDEAAEESEDEYAGLGGASDDEAGSENEADRQMIDEDTQVGRGDEAKLAGLFADRERKSDEAAVSKLLKDITTGALRRKRGVGDDLDLSDEEDAAARRREAKRREFAKMRRELLKDEAVGKIAEDRKKEAFLRSIEDREQLDEDEEDFDGQETPQDESQSQSQSQNPLMGEETRDTSVSDPQADLATAQKKKRPLEISTDSQLNRHPPSLRRATTAPLVHKRPTTLAEIRETVSFLIEEPDSQAGTIDLGLSDSEEEPEKYVNLDRHFASAENDENAEDDDAEDLGDFIVDDDGLAEKEWDGGNVFKKPDLPASKTDRAPFGDRRTRVRANVVDRLQLLRQASSSSTGSSHGSGAKMAFFTKSSSSTDLQFGKVASLLRRATTNNSSFGSMAGRGEEMSATGVVTNTTERGRVEDEKEFVRKGMGGRRNAVNYRVKEKPGAEMTKKAGVRKSVKGGKAKGANSGFLGGLFRGDSWG